MPQCEWWREKYLRILENLITIVRFLRNELLGYKKANNDVRCKIFFAQGKLFFIGA